MILVAPDPQKFSPDRLETPSKVIYIIFIFALFLSNISLIVLRIIRKRSRAFTKAKYSIQLSLAVAGLVSGLFVQVVNTIVRFDMKSHDLNCKTVYLADCFLYTFLPLLYAIGLLLLSLDLVLRFKTAFYKVLSKSKFYSFFCAILPWCVAFLVSCPLTLMDVEWGSKCELTQSTRERQITIIVCVIVPAGLVLVTSLAVGIGIKPTRSYNFEGFDSPMTIMGNGSSESYTPKEINLNGSPGTTNTTPKHDSCGSTPSSPPPTPIFVTSGNTHGYPLFTNNQARGFSREKLKLMASLILFFIFCLPYGVMFVFITEDYATAYPGVYLYIVEVRVFFSYFVSILFLIIYAIVLPLLWLFCKY